MITSHPYAIVGIEVENLFGYINQNIEADENNKEKIGKLAILYGENGTGKTMLLRLAFHLVSGRIDRGHKSALLSTIFKKLRVRLKDGSIFEADRPKTSAGAYTFSVKIPESRKRLVHEFEPVDPNESSVAPYEFSSDMAKAIERRASTIFFLGDDRLIEMESANELSSEDLMSRVRRATGIRGRKVYRTSEELTTEGGVRDLLGNALQEAISRLERWFDVQFGQRTSSGMASSHAIYEEVIQKLVAPSGKERASDELDVMLKRLEELSEESLVLEKYGLSARINIAAISRSLSKAPKEQDTTLRLLLSPYVETVAARFQELREIYTTIDTFITETNRFLRPKSVTFKIGKGIHIFAPNGYRLGPNQLSSGERHLLLILASAVLSKSNRILFFVDEPEISLNATWQRNLVSTLLALSHDSQSQFLLASHSLPLISNYRDHVLRLSPEYQKSS